MELAKSFYCGIMAALLLTTFSADADSKTTEKAAAKAAAPRVMFEKDYDVRAGLGKFDIVYKDAKESPMVVEGLPWFKENKGAYYRTPLRLKVGEVSSGVKRLSNKTAGVAVRFRTDSPAIVLRGELAFSSYMAHMTRVGSSGFDSYCKDDSGKWVFGKSFLPAYKQVEFKTVIGYNAARTMRDWMINFPLYGGVKLLEIGVVKGSKIELPTPHKVKKPILFYGSSITQGGCASRPGMSYNALLCRAVDAEQINLGFSGNAKGETAMAEEIAKLDLAAFIYDYDYNAPNVAHLEKTHEKFFRIIRDKNPDLPIIVLSRINHPKSAQTATRRSIIKKTCDNSAARGDKNTWFLNGIEFFGSDDYYECTVDGTHPNDLGFYRMYKAVLPTLKKALKLQ